MTRNILSIVPADTPITRDQAQRWYGYTLERDIQGVMLPKPFIRVIYLVTNGTDETRIEVRTLDQIYWDSLCTKNCGCHNFEEAILKHPELLKLRGESEFVKINYTNWQGETRDRIIKPLSMFFGSTDYHKEKQWLLNAYDLEKKATRTFSMKDIHKWEQYV